jgi:glycosyltransferase involved in cell wall biosynthesis
VRISVVNLTHGGFSGGYLKYLQQLVPRLLAHPDIELQDVFIPEEARGAFENPSWRFRTFQARQAGGILALRRMVREGQPDLVFVPTQSLIDFGGVPTVVMVRNMEPLEVPFGGNPPSAILKNLARGVMVRRACRRATRIIAVSKHVRAFLTEHWSVAPEKVGVVYHGVGGSDVPAPRRPAPLAALEGPFLFTAGSIRPARGLIDVVEAMGRLRATHPHLVAVIAGGIDYGMQRHAQRLERRAAELGVADRIRRVGRLDAAAMRWCYEHATAFVMTSRAEACPNITLEAMSFGCACISVDRPPMPEFFVDAAQYYRPGDAGQLAEAIARLLADPHRARALRAGAVARASQFDWDDTARRTVEELKTALGR